ncbi:ABC transporter permease [Actinoalloteichus hymeniacidonis]|uniref:ABC-type dipeptide/oligopeptide/nickel transport system, permease component n=1 Tax=Actinoalloteichus hymeniacidonis TaxID=340345 RepID=A0AAC9HQP7_9PSEU|nr:ABC transporter permease [Actinoalloteichus hymeniacidonis]AOS63769.1 ABC-type dipeptide/oligopeptide/nickel transport system, permease component [Actinoalloteichus hymeniacidonis]MBB5908177.1 peptide/nickel transport system permease protein [Actinoalloteichus hymeniacidonis]
MPLYIARRLVSAVFVLLAVVFFTFVVFFVLTPDPALSICGQTCTPDRIEDIRTRLGLEDPFWVQFWVFLAGIFVGRTYGEGPTAIMCEAPCLGYSFQTRQSVMTMIGDRIDVTVTIAIGAALLWLLVGVGAGLLSAVKAGTWWDRGATGLALGGIALPNYFVALILQWLLVVQLEVLPFPTVVAFGEDPLRWFQTYLMPWIVLSIMYAAMYTRMTRANVIETLSENYVRTARAKGLSNGKLLTRHALRPSLTPVATLFGMDFAALLGGALITETVFGLNGVGKLAYDAIGTNDQPVIMGVTLLAGAAVVLMNIVVDLLYPLLDPRVRKGTR